MDSIVDIFIAVVPGTVENEGHFKYYRVLTTLSYASYL